VALSSAIVERLTLVTGIQFEPTDASYKHLIEFLVTGDALRLASDLGFYFEAMEACAATTRRESARGL
jgi:hypothetical protein